MLDDLRRAHEDSGGRYGSPRVHAALRAHGRQAGRGRVGRLMRRHGVRGLAARRRQVQATDSSPPFPVAPNLLGRQFAAPKPNQAWLAGLTCIATGEGWLHVAAIMDLRTRKPDAERPSEIVGWPMRDHLRAELATSALTRAVQRQRPGAGLTHRSDRGIQYACGFHTLKTERVHHRTYATRDEAKRGLFSCMEEFCNRRRLHSSLGYRTPVQAEQRALRVA